RPRGRVVLREAGILIDRRDEIELYVALNKGGVFKLFRDGRLAASDTQLSLRVRAGRGSKNPVGHLIGNYQTETNQDEITIRGALGWAKHKQMTTPRLVVLRLIMVTAGRFFPNLIRKLLQKMLITGKSDAPFEFIRTLKWEGSRLKIIDELRA